MYEREKGIFFNDLSGAALEDATLSRLLGMPQVLLTPHQGFATEKALTEIAQTTYHSLQSWHEGKTGPHELHYSH
ncbi:hypothetical protein [Flaviaesturariibacter amylovorans]|uniref:D-isomer specific 2-hydroxyacid dehydrogenase NAD-binding domain-containing protein n=1 Tax=Flaviaesturariibacter amylovorans TaxID=1084520 RepID=A0ABP8H5F7_9BACT